MEDLIAILRAAAVTDATDEARQAGIAASQALLAAFSQPGASGVAPSGPIANVASASASPPIASPTSAPAPSTEPAPAQSPASSVPPSSPSSFDPTAIAAIVHSPSSFDPTAIAAIVHSLRGLPPEQLLDLAITRLRAALPPERLTTPMAPSTPLRFQLVPVPPQWRNTAPTRKP
jgi:hypothetical protein